jgi:hypothetical protein
VALNPLRAAAAAMQADVARIAQGERSQSTAANLALGLPRLMLRSWGHVLSWVRPTVWVPAA